MHVPNLIWTWETERSGFFPSNWMQSITKTRQDNDVIDRISVISAEYDTELSRLMGQCTIDYKDKT